MGVGCRVTDADAKAEEDVEAPEARGEDVGGECGVGEARAFGRRGVGEDS